MRWQRLPAFRKSTLTVGALATALAQFHREVVVPDMHRTFDFHKLDKVADLRTRVDSLQAQVRSLEKRFDGLSTRHSAG